MVVPKFSSESDPKNVKILSSRIPSLPKKRKSEEIGTTPRPIEDALEILKKSKSYIDHHNPQAPAVFENGMRKTPGRGRMNSDYDGMVLPLLDEFKPSSPGLYEVPWSDRRSNSDYKSIKDGTER